MLYWTIILLKCCFVVWCSICWLVLSSGKLQSGFVEISLVELSYVHSLGKHSNWNDYSSIFFSFQLLIKYCSSAQVINSKLKRNIFVARSHNIFNRAPSIQGFPIFNYKLICWRNAIGVSAHLTLNIWGHVLLQRDSRKMSNASDFTVMENTSVTSFGLGPCLPG